MQPPHVKYAANRGPWLDTWLADHAAELSWKGWRYFPVHWYNLGLSNPTMRKYNVNEALRWFERSVPSTTMCATMYLWADALPRSPRNLFVAGPSHGNRLVPFVTRPMIRKGIAKTISVSFVGTINRFTDFNGVRSLTSQSVSRLQGSVVLTKWVSSCEFDRLTEASVFTAAPRGYGPTSYRLYEAMGMGSIPIYIWDQRICLPLADRYDWSRLAVIVHKNELHTLRERLASIDPHTREDMLDQGHKFYSRHCTLAGAANTFVELLPSTTDPLNLVEAEGMPKSYPQTDTIERLASRRLCRPPRRPQDTDHRSRGR